MRDDQRAAGVAAMRGSFKFNDVMQALMRANVPLDQLRAKAHVLIKEEETLGHVRQQSDDLWMKL